MIAAAGPLRDRARLLLLQSLHVCRQHYGSMVTFVVLSVTLTLALTSSSFSSRVASSVANPPPASKIQLPEGFGRAHPPAMPRVTFYLYEDEAQRKLFQDILRSDATNMARMGLPDYIGDVYFLRVADEAEEQYANFLVNEITSYTGVEGFSINLSVVDLR
jgi:hypothetical protein